MEPSCGDDALFRARHNLEINEPGVSGITGYRALSRLLNLLGAPAARGGLWGSSRQRRKNSPRAGIMVWRVIFDFPSSHGYFLKRLLPGKWIAVIILVQIAAKP